MNFDTLSAISPVDGRYSNKTKPLNTIFSEFGLIKYRVLVEVEWLKALSNNESIAEVPLFSEKAIKLLDGIVNNFSIDDANSVKTIESTTNHDVKAVEYFLKDKIKGSE